MSGAGDAAGKRARAAHTHFRLPEPLFVLHTSVLCLRAMFALPRDAKALQDKIAKKRDEEAAAAAAPAAAAPAGAYRHVEMLRHARESIVLRA